MKVYDSRAQKIYEHFLKILSEPFTGSIISPLIAQRLTQIVLEKEKPNWGRFNFEEV